MSKQLICKKCGGPRDIGRRLCRPCNLDRLKAKAKETPRYTWDKECLACKNGYKAWRKEQTICSKCYQDMVKLKSLNPSNNKYVSVKVNGKFVHAHRALAEEVLGRKLTTNEVVHHMDDNPKNNSVENLIVLSRTWHGRLHNYLYLQRVIFEKSKNENSENCWEALIVPMTTTWLETASVTVIKLWEIG